jgi:hypothetical protein
MNARTAIAINSVPTHSWIHICSFLCTYVHTYKPKFQISNVPRYMYVSRFCQYLSKKTSLNMYIVKVSVAWCGMVQWSWNPSKEHDIALSYPARA